MVVLVAVVDNGGIMYQCYLVNNACYLSNAQMSPKGIVVHSTGANNPNISRYVQPASGQTVGITNNEAYMRSVLGTNKYNNDWNHYYVDERNKHLACVNAFIGRLAGGSVDIVQTLPWTTQPWGCGTGNRGSYNYTHIQFEICEDDLTSETYFREVMDKAAELCAYLAQRYTISTENIVSHHESYLKGYGNNHADIDHWLKVYGMTMDDFRNMVTDKFKEGQPMTAQEKKNFEALQEEVAKLKKELDTCFEKYNWTTACPKWAQDTVHKLLTKGILKGRDDGQLYLSDQMIRILVMLDRAGTFD